MSDTYILDGQQPVACDLMTWARWFERARRHVAVDPLNNGRVSTVFLGLDHRFGDEGPPILFETMVFGGVLDGEMRRYSTWEEAAHGHIAVLDFARKRAGYSRSHWRKIIREQELNHVRARPLRLE